MSNDRRKDRARPACDSHEPVRARPLEIIAERVGNDFEKMLRRFTKNVRLDGILKEAVEKSRFVKPSELRRKKAMAARRRERSEAL